MSVDGGGRHDRPSDKRILHLDRAPEQSNTCPSSDNLDRFTECRRESRAPGPTGCPVQTPRPGPGRTTRSTSSRMAIPPTSTGARAGSMPRVWRRRSSGRTDSRSRSACRRSRVRMWPSIRVGSYRSSSRSIAAHCVGVPATAIAWVAGGCSGSLYVRAQSGEFVAGGRVRVEVALAVADDADLRRGVPRDGAAGARARAPSSRRRCRSPAPARCHRAARWRPRRSARPLPRRSGCGCAGRVRARRGSRTRRRWWRREPRRS